MGAFNFKAQFRDKIRDREKITTIRRLRKDGKDPTVGTKMKLYVGRRMRKRPGRRLIGEVKINKRVRVEITKAGALFLDGIEITGDSKDLVAKFDGFDSWEELFSFFEGMHGHSFVGFLYRWEWEAIE